MNAHASDCGRYMGGNPLACDCGYEPAAAPIERAHPDRAILLALAAKVIESRDARKDEDIDAWANRLAADSVACGESEYGPNYGKSALNASAAQACEVLSPDGGYACTADAGRDGGHWWTDPLGPACDRCGARNTTLKNEQTFLFCFDRKGCHERKAARSAVDDLKARVRRETIEACATAARAAHSVYADDIEAAIRDLLKGGGTK